MQSQSYTRENDDVVVARDPAHPPKPSKSLYWTDPMVEALLEALIEQVRLGKRSDSGFKAEAYKAALPKVREQMIPERYEGGYLCAEIAKLRAKVASLKTLYGAFLKLLNESGFGKDAESGLITADDEVWDRYLMVRLAIARL